MTDSNGQIPPGYILRSASWEDARRVADLIILTDIAERGESDYELNDLLEDWHRPGFDPGADAWVVADASGGIVGYEELYNRNEHAFLSGDGYVHPAHLGRGIGTALLRALQVRAGAHLALAPAEARVFVRNGLSAPDTAARELHEHEGYAPVRYFWRMEIKQQTAPPPPDWPEGMAMRCMQPGQDDRRVFQALTEAFADHWGFVPEDYENWCRRRLQVEAFDPSLWFLGMDGGEIAGAAICRMRSTAGWVSTLGVRPAWRRRGLGLALLRQSLAEFYRRGVSTVGLGVDAANPTGATRLYEKAGMHVAHEFVLYEKELRPGIDLGE
jgi:mycothiol synthase